MFPLYSVIFLLYSFISLKLHSVSFISLIVRRCSPYIRFHGFQANFSFILFQSPSPPRQPFFATGPSNTMAGLHGQPGHCSHRTYKATTACTFIKPAPAKKFLFPAINYQLCAAGKSPGEKNKKFSKRFFELLSGTCSQLRMLRVLFKNL